MTIKKTSSKRATARSAARSKAAKKRKVPPGEVVMARAYRWVKKK